MGRTHWPIVAKSMQAAPLTVSMRHVMSPWRYHWYLPLPPNAMPTGGSRGMESEMGRPAVGLASDAARAVGCGVDVGMLAAGATVAGAGLVGAADSASSFASGGSAERSRWTTSPPVETARLPVWV